jgi:hypothetical protein
MSETTTTTTTAIASPLVLQYGDSSGDYAAMLTPGGTGFWQNPDGIAVATWRDCTEAEESAIHYAGDDDATAYMEMRGSFYGPEDVLVFGCPVDYGIATGDLIIASPRLDRMIHVTIATDEPVDTSSSASRQHFIDTGFYLTVAEVAAHEALNAR